MSNKHPQFTVAMYGNALEAYKAKAEYYEKALIRKQDDNVTLAARNVVLNEKTRVKMVEQCLVCDSLPSHDGKRIFHEIECPIGIQEEKDADNGLG